MQKKQAINTNDHINYRYMDYLDIDYIEEFDVAVMIFCDLGVLSIDTAKDFLKKVNKSLKKKVAFLYSMCGQHQMKN